MVLFDLLKNMPCAFECDTQMSILQLPLWNDYCQFKLVWLDNKTTSSIFKYIKCMVNNRKNIDKMKKISNCIDQSEKENQILQSNRKNDL